MIFVVAIACAVAVVFVAVRGEPLAAGVRRAAAGVGAFCVAGYLWVNALWVVVPWLAPVFAALRGVGLDTAFGFLVYFAPPTAAGLAALRLVGSSRRARMSA